MFVPFHKISCCVDDDEDDYKTSASSLPKKSGGPPDREVRPESSISQRSSYYDDEKAVGSRNVESDVVEVSFVIENVCGIYNAIKSISSVITKIASQSENKKYYSKNVRIQGSCSVFNLFVFLGSAGPRVD